MLRDHVTFRILSDLKSHSSSKQLICVSYELSFIPKSVRGNSVFISTLPILGDPGAVSRGGKKAKRARKKIGRRKVKKESRSPWDSSLNRPVPKPFKILACDWAQKYFIGHKNILPESSSFRVTFVNSYSKVFTAKLFARLFAIYLLARAGEFPSIEKCH